MQAAHRSACDQDEGAGAKQAEGLLIPGAKDATHGPCCFCCQRDHKAHLQESRPFCLPNVAAQGAADDGQVFNALSK